MEFAEQPRPSGACSHLGVPGLITLDEDDDDGEVVIGIRPKSSPLPRRRSSVTDEDSEPEPPLCGSRRVSFADAKGLSLVQVKEFGMWDVPKLPGYESSEGEGIDAEDYFLSPLTFSLPLSTEELFARVREQKIELETIKLLPGTTILKGVIRVLNISFSKAVYVRTTLDSWSSHFDLLAEYIPGSTDGLTDCFSFKLTLVPPFGEQGARVDFCLRYETSVGTFWANNTDRNYVFFCHHRIKEDREKPQRDNVNKKSCLKTVSQNFSSVENISKEASSQENISTDVSNHGLEVDTLKDKKISDGQSGASEGQAEKIENTQTRSRRSRRKAARMARVRDYFAQRNGGASDTERDESPPEVKQATQQETREEKHPNVQSFSEGNSKSEDSQSICESLEACSESPVNVLHDTSSTNDYTSNSESEKSESLTLARSATLPGGESATDIPDNPVHSVDHPAPAEQQLINRYVTKPEESSHKPDMSYECTSDATAESSGSLVGQTSSFTFGTVVAPLYHQVFGKVGSESESVADWGNPVRASVNIGDLNPHTERRQISCIVPTDDKDNDGKVQENVMNNQESNHETLDTTLNSLPTEEEETSLSVTANDVLDCADTLQDPAGIENSDQRSTNTSQTPKPLLQDTIGQPILFNTDLLNPQTPTESLHLQGEAQEDHLTHDLQTTAETAQCQLPELTCTQSTTNLDATQEVRISLQSSFALPSQSESGHVIEETDQQTSSTGENNCKCVEINKDPDIRETVTISTTDASLQEDKLLAVLHNLNSNHIDHSVTKEAESSLVSCCELEKIDFTTPETSVETQEETTNMEGGKNVTHSSHEVETKHSGGMNVTAESTTEEVMSDDGRCGDMFVELKGEDVAEHCEMEAAISKQDEDFSLADVTEVKNWERMVEEEEGNILTNKEESETLILKAEDTEMIEKDTTEQKAEELVEEITAAGVKEDMADNAVGLEDKESIREEEIGETEAGNDRGDVEIQSEYVQGTKTEKTAGEEELAVETDVEKTEGPEETELQKEKHFAEMQEVSMTNVQEEEEIKEEEKMEIDLNDEGEAGVGWEDQEENPDRKEETLGEEAGEAEIVDADSCMVVEDGEDEVGCLEERQDITPNNAENGLSALNNGRESVNVRVTDKENTGEGQTACIQTEIHLYEEECFQSNKTVTHDRSKARTESSAAEGDERVLTDDPENDQTSDGSASAESDSDDEVELYMHCLRAVQTGARAHKDGSRDTGFTLSKRPSLSRSKLLPTRMPSISESLDEEQPHSHVQENPEDVKTTAVTAMSASGEQGNVSRNVSWWKDTFSCSNISKTLLYTSLFVVFLVVAFHYDFLACFGLYLISVVWLFCQGEKQAGKKNNRIG